MASLLSALAARAKRSDWANQIVRYAFGSNADVREVIREMSSADAARRAELQRHLVLRTLTQAAKTRYGRGRPLVLNEWPMLDKAIVREKQRDFMAPALLKVPASTSGSTGQPLRLWRGLKSITAEQTFLDHLAQRRGKSFGAARIAVLRGDAPRRPGPGSPTPNHERLGRRRLILASGNLNQDTVNDYVHQLKAFQPDILWIYPTAGDMLASMLLDRKITVKVPLVMSSSEMLGGDAMMRIRAAFDTEVVDYYGQAERMCMAVSTAPNEAFFVPSYGHVELIPLEDGQAGLKVKQAKVVATGFWNDVFPLVRYDTGDLAEYDAGYSESDLQLAAIGLLPIRRVVGRENSYLLTPSGARFQGLENIVREIGGIRRAQFIQHGDLSVELRLVPDAPIQPSQLEGIETTIRSKMPDDLKICVKSTDRLEASASGKTAFVVRR